MEKPVLISVQLTNVITANQITASLWIATRCGREVAPKASTLNNIRARARAVRPL